MLLTVAWGGSLIAARCDLDDKVAYCQHRSPLLCDCTSSLTCMSQRRQKHAHTFESQSYLGHHGAVWHAAHDRKRKKEAGHDTSGHNLTCRG